MTPEAREFPERILENLCPSRATEVRWSSQHVKCPVDALGSTRWFPFLMNLRLATDRPEHSLRVHWEEGKERMRDRRYRRSGKRWPGPDRWQVTLSAISLVVAVVALAEQVKR